MNLTKNEKGFNPPSKRLEINEKIIIGTLSTPFLLSSSSWVAFRIYQQRATTEVFILFILVKDF